MLLASTGAKMLQLSRRAGAKERAECRQPISASTASVFLQRHLELTRRYQGPAPLLASVHSFGRFPTRSICERISPRRRSRRLTCVQAVASASKAAASKTDLSAYINAATVVTLSVSNRVLQKLALLPMRPYVFFLGQALSLFYVVIYSLSLAHRVWAGKVPRSDVFGQPQGPFILIGLLECVAQVLGLFAASALPGSLLPVLGQTFLVWQFVFSRILLRTAFNRYHVAGAALVLAGLLIVNAPATISWQGAQAASGLALPVTLFCVSTLLLALDVIFKERLFRDARNRGRPLDLFIVNTFGSFWQAAFTFLLLPVNASLRGVPLAQLPSYLTDGLSCLLGATPAACALGGHSCGGAPLLPALYIACNLALNISALRLLQTSSAVVSSLVSSLAVPLTVLAFAMPLPLLGAAPALTGRFWVGTLVLFAGLLLYQVASKLMAGMGARQQQRAGVAGALPPAAAAVGQGNGAPLVRSAEVAASAAAVVTAAPGAAVSAAAAAAAEDPQPQRGGG